MPKAELARLSFLKSLPSDSTAKLQGTTIKGSVANLLAKNPREERYDNRIEGVFSVSQVDTRNPDGFRVQLRNLATGQIFSAKLALTIDREIRKVIEQATWEKQPVHCIIDMTRRSGRIDRARIVKATPAPDSRKTTVKANRSET